MKDEDKTDLIKGYGCGCVSWIITNLFIFGYFYDCSFKKHKHKVWDNIDWKWWIIINLCTLSLALAVYLWCNKKEKKDEGKHKNAPEQDNIQKDNTPLESQDKKEQV